MESKKKNLNWYEDKPNKPINEEIKEQMRDIERILSQDNYNSIEIPTVDLNDNAFNEIIKNQDKQIKHLENEAKSSKKWTISNFITAILSLLLAIASLIVSLISIA